MPCPHVVAGSQIDVLDAPRETTRAQKQLQVSRPTAAAHHGFVADRFEQLTQHRDSIKTISSEWIGGVRFREAGALDPRGELAKSAYRRRRFRQLLPGRNDVCSADRLLVAPDCGMKYLPKDVAFGKLRAMTEAAGRVRAGL